MPFCPISNCGEGRRKGICAVRPRTDHADSGPAGRRAADRAEFLRKCERTRGYCDQRSVENSNARWQRRSGVEKYNFCNRGRKLGWALLHQRLFRMDTSEGNGSRSPRRTHPGHFRQERGQPTRKSGDLALAFLNNSNFAHIRTVNLSIWTIELIFVV